MPAYAPTATTRSLDTPPKPRPLPGAGAPARTLVQMLARDGWGELHGRWGGGVRATLIALSLELPAHGAGLVTTPQVALAAGQSDRWTTRCLHLLEDLGVITWTRGGVVAGVATPSGVRIIRQRLVELIEAARPLKAAAESARRTATLARILLLKTLYVVRNRRSRPPELSAYLPPYQGRVLTSPLPVLANSNECAHGYEDPGRSCGICRRRSRGETGR
jgi:hypothetical protein